MGRSTGLGKRIIEQTFNGLGYEITRIGTGDGYERLSQKYSNYQCLKLHVGCGPRILKGWINIDSTDMIYMPYQMFADKYYPEEIRGDKSDFFTFDITKVGLPLPDNSVDVIFHEDFLEHLNQRDQVIFLAEALRVLKLGGIHRVSTPNLAASMRAHSDFTKGLAGVYYDEWNTWHHQNVMTAAMLEEMSKMVGYSKVIFTEKDKSTSALVPLDNRPWADRPQLDGNIFADLIK